MSVFCITIYKVHLIPLEVFLALWQSWNVYGIDTVPNGIWTVVTILNPWKQNLGNVYSSGTIVISMLIFCNWAPLYIHLFWRVPLLCTLYINKVMFSVTAQNSSLQTYSWRYFLYSSAAWWWNLERNRTRSQCILQSLGMCLYTILKLEIHSIKLSFNSTGVLVRSWLFCIPDVPFLDNFCVHAWYQHAKTSLALSELI